VAVDLQVARGPLLVEHAQGNLRVARDSLGLGPLGHGRDDNLMPVRAVVDNRHRRAVFRSAVAEDRSPVIKNELPPLLRGHRVASADWAGCSPAAPLAAGRAPTTNASACRITAGS